jgi:hypothetical protein
MQPLQAPRVFGVRNQPANTSMNAFYAFYSMCTCHDSISCYDLVFLGISKDRRRMRRLLPSEGHAAAAPQKPCTVIEMLTTDEVLNFQFVMET